ncbi:MAG: hypothetical protein AAGF66_13055 [Cyanobacteria bacterium P01_H01_bin.119]
MDISSTELKFLIRLLPYPAYRAAVGHIKLGDISAKERNRLCQTLRRRGWIDYSTEVLKYMLTPAGRTLLRLGTTSLPVTPDELYMIRAAAHQPASPSQVSRVSLCDRQGIIHELVGRKILKIKTSQIKDVWLTQAGTVFLRDRCLPKGVQSTLSLSMLSDYLTFLRRSLTAPAELPPSVIHQSVTDQNNAVPVMDDYRASKLPNTAS